MTQRRNLSQWNERKPKVLGNSHVTILNYQHDSAESERASLWTFRIAKSKFPLLGKTKIMVPSQFDLRKNSFTWINSSGSKLWDRVRAKDHNFKNSGRSLMRTWCSWLAGISKPSYIWSWWEPCAFVVAARNPELPKKEANLGFLDTWKITISLSLFPLRRNFCLLGSQEYLDQFRFPANSSSPPP